MNILLISEKTLKTESYINDNVDSCYILPSIQTAQEIGLQSLIGTALLDDIKSQIERDEITDSTKKLLDEYIKPYLIHKVMSDIQIPLAFKMRNSGAVQTNNEYENNTYIKDVRELINYYNQKANFYAIRLAEYLCANSNLYPKYKACNKGDMKADKKAYNTGIFLNY